MTTKYLVLGELILCLLGCSNEPQVTKSVGEETAASNSLSTPKPEPTIQSPVKVIGTFSNRDGNGEHEWGYEVDIWEHNGHLIGMFTGSAGTRLVGDPPTGILVDQVFDEKTGKFSFKTTTPSFTYRFDGTLTKKALKGRLSNVTWNVTEKITLERSKESSSEMDEYARYEDWKEYADRILKFRGPKPS